MKAQVCGPKIRLRDWRKVRAEKRSKGEEVCAFAEKYLRVPDGIHAGEPLHLEPFQERFIRAVVDNPHGTRKAILSVARRNGKSFLTAVLLLAYLVGPMARKYATVCSAANSREQAALIFRLMTNMVMQSQILRQHLHVIPSGKRIIATNNNSEYYAMSADAKTGYGRSIYMLVLDESGQIRGPTSEYIDMLRTSQGSYEDPLFLTISTQAPSDADWLSIQIDDAIRTQDKHTVCHLYAADQGANMTSRAQMKKANPGLGVFRSIDDLAEQLEQAKRLPSEQAGKQNLLLNMRISQSQLWLAPEPWKDCGGKVDLEVFKTGTVAMGLDLSSRVDLTAAVIASKDDKGDVHLLPYTFIPLEGIEDRAGADRAPYAAWVRDEFMVGVPGSSIDFDFVAQYLKAELERLEIDLDVVAFDPWRIDYFRKAAIRQEFADDAQWQKVAQLFKDMSPRLEIFEALVLEGKIRHGAHPLLNMAASNAIAYRDGNNNCKLMKNKSTQRIDPLIAAVMATFPVTDGEEEDLDVSFWIV